MIRAANAQVDFPIGYSSLGGTYAFISLIEEQRLEGVIDQVALARAGAIDNDLTRPLKILGNGELSQAIHVRANKVSASARAKIEAAGGTVEVIGGEAEAPEGESE